MSSEKLELQSAPTQSCVVLPGLLLGKGEEKKKKENKKQKTKQTKRKAVGCQPALVSQGFPWLLQGTGRSKGMCVQT